ERPILRILRHNFERSVDASGYCFLAHRIACLLRSREPVQRIGCHPAVVFIMLPPAPAAGAVLESVEPLQPVPHHLRQLLEPAGLSRSPVWLLSAPPHSSQNPAGHAPASGPSTRFRPSTGYRPPPSASRRSRRSSPARDPPHRHSSSPAQPLPALVSGSACC